MKLIPTLALALLVAAFAASAADKSPVWTDPVKAAQEDPDFIVQGEYGLNREGASVGVQVVALGDGKFDAYVLEGGLPGLGWTKEKKRVRLSGAREGDLVKFAEAGGFSAEIRDDRLSLYSNGGSVVEFPKIERRSPTLGMRPPEGAVVLFDGSSADEWEKGKVADGLLAATGCLSKKKFKDCTIHLEFRTPYKPKARGQQRGNSGVYYGGRWETQVLDSFGLDGKMNECGGIYSIAAPKLNMCFPPLSWQTYDVELTDARFDEDGKRTAWPRITVKLNGVVVHDDVELNKDGTTACPVKGPLTDEGNPLFLQNHGNPVFYRNIWVVEK
ncbi:hypothetical protein HAHE_06670 [Haloferula helveola]|uniref:3-keto-alpha-glucoside-1,2-lyase/3-keto-2-hydroxy-glucal hydratase domain-containing protein n=1 Tax=Haloferula helveola TaxID=490095 RepID=A0ABN6GZR8_9BACT|nr:hypothetical protein HAHE_06670 [Haloferula helveola]